MERRNICSEFAKILGAEILTSNNKVCAVTFMRDIPAETLGRPIHSPLALSALFSFESIDNPLAFARKVADALRGLRK
ncbi:DUF1259 domain-containing protein [Clostridium fungisolvens]|uniref:Uncharacterized protein n=1 Tax=Clostridium fungisolvens TaxID=1604897 RepID=A0A6V8SM50_9CLOT|nr:DUF1259 domain-containing protein [Clostridium fungisolvens]GFP78309.1 hypothetical protein bsdtw1_04527 [Clostridium fungisolvens]